MSRSLMSRSLRTALLASFLAGSVPALAAAPLELRPTPEIDLPFGDDIGFPAGPGSDVIASNCTACHSADHTLNQPALSREEWHAVVDKMITAYKAPITPEDARVIVDYLARVKGEP
ncbi:Quinohemoprotein amine dehydrogenase A, alpha subunit, haem binding [Methylobacterium phyllostachyos]|uniref:Quinohemoprotein amine dehydrogenase A, alpha subunit, haem binding n=2 Tax=Methylobacterium phyllostachyos TaxID=582672 RepID=A0A1G9ZYE6_9HYPH|nr:Quinohemoprotein amine dehydrogenase A, alpha subunit, haem binding [Methylobacterium phyllostachyos]